MKLLIIIVLMLNPLKVFSSGDVIRNGGGVAENYLVYALHNLGQSIDLCLAQPTCVQESSGRNILLKIRDSLPEEINSNILKFTSNAEKPGFFIVDGFVRLAVTGDRVGNPIYYNLDLLYSKDEVRMNYGQAVQSLIHELGHHQDEIDHVKLELLGTAVRNSVEGRISTADYLPHLNQASFLALGVEKKSFEHSGSLALIFKDQIVDVTSQFKEVYEKCDRTGLGENLKSRSIQFYNLHWLNGVPHIPMDKLLSGYVVLYCRVQTSKGFKDYRKFFEFHMFIKVSFSDHFKYINSRIAGKYNYRFKMLENSTIL